jgi:uncharacterized surface protein with fasciclin (FAS1) repeats
MFGLSLKNELGEGMMRAFHYVCLVLCLMFGAFQLNACDPTTPTENPTETTPTETAGNEPTGNDAAPADNTPTEKGTTEMDPKEAGPMKTILDIATTDSNFSILAAAVTKAGLVDALKGNDLTVFAPTNDAFVSLLKDDLGLTVDTNDPLKDLTKEQLIPILKYHVLGSKVDAKAATTAAGSNSSVDSLGGSIALSLDGTSIKLDGRATVTKADVMATNGIIHVIDKVILPSITDVLANSAKDLGLEQLLAAVGAADNGKDAKDKLTTLLDGAGPFTVFAPMDSAFAKVLTDNGLADLGALVTALGGQEQLIGLLKYHVAAARLTSKEVVAADGKEVTVASGGKVSVTVDGGKVILNKGVTAGVKGVNDSEVKVIDIYTSNGVIHILGAVIAPAPAP